MLSAKLPAQPSICRDNFRDYGRHVANRIDLLVEREHPACPAYGKVSIASAGVIDRVVGLMVLVRTISAEIAGVLGNLQRWEVVDETTYIDVATAIGAQRSNYLVRRLGGRNTETRLRAKSIPISCEIT
jgi:hypothetical protein